MEKRKNETKSAIKVSIIGIFTNIFLSCFKFFAGIFGKSYAMVADAIHSLSDVFTSIIVIFGVKIASKEADKNHQYGHDRFECISALVLSFILFSVGFSIGKNAVESLVSGSYLEKETPKLIALVAAVVSIISQAIMFFVAMDCAKKTKFGAVKADAWHHLSDSLSSVGSLIGIGGAMLGVKVLDVVAGFVISLLIIKVSVEIFIDSVSKMTDKAVSKDLEKQIRSTIRSISGVENVDNLRTRIFGNKFYIDVEIACDGSLTLEEAHKIAQRVHDKIEREFPSTKHCLVHMNPILKKTGKVHKKSEQNFSNNSKQTNNKQKKNIEKI